MTTLIISHSRLLWLREELILICSLQSDKENFMPPLKRFYIFLYFHFLLFSNFPSIPSHNKHHAGLYATQTNKPHAERKRLHLNARSRASKEETVTLTKDSHGSWQAIQCVLIKGDNIYKEVCSSGYSGFSDPALEAAAATGQLSSPQHSLHFNRSAPTGS